MKVEYKVPKVGTMIYRISEMLCRSGPKTYGEIVDIMSGFGLSQKMVHNALARMRADSWIVYESKKYYPPAHILEFFGVEQCTESVQPRTAPEKRPLSTKYIPSLNPLLQGRFRTDVGFKNGSVGFSIGYAVAGGLPVRS
jgi:hypothetical protein